MKKRILSLLLAAAMLVLLAVPAFAEDEHAYTYVALGDSITTGVGLKDATFPAPPRAMTCRKTIIITPKTAMWPGWPTPWAWTGTMP